VGLETNMCMQTQISYKLISFEVTIPVSWEDCSQYFLGNYLQSFRF